MPLVSIIVPAYNTAPYIRETLQSVFAQTFTDYEVVVVNDGSPDTEELERVLEPYQGRIRYLKQENRGLSAARNAGIRASQSPMIALLDSDDLWEPEYLSVQVAEMMRDPSIDVLYPNALIFADSSRREQKFMDLSPSESEVTFEALVTQRCTVMVSAMARRKIILDAGLFDENLKMNEDFDLWLRIMKLGGRIAYHRRILARYRRRKGSLSSNQVRMCEGFIQVLDKAQRTMSLSTSEKAALEQARSFTCAELQFWKGKTAFLQSNPKIAIDNLKNANQFFKSRKIALAIIMLRFAPGLLLQVYRLRNRLIYQIS
jgi:glycosyltransferase involved in cell wall biosynthesis